LCVFIGEGYKQDKLFTFAAAWKKGACPVIKNLLQSGFQEIRPVFSIGEPTFFVLTGGSLTGL
jgi:hypothetical protein